MAVLLRIQRNSLRKSMAFQICSGIGVEKITTCAKGEFFSDSFRAIFSCSIFRSENAGYTLTRPSLDIAVYYSLPHREEKRNTNRSQWTSYEGLRAKVSKKKVRVKVS